MIARAEDSNTPTNSQNKLYLIVRSIRLTKENYRTGRPSGDVVDLFPGYSLQQKLRPSVGQVFNYGLQTIVGSYLLQHWQNQCWGFIRYFKYLKWDTLQQPQASIPLFQLLYKHRTKMSVLHAGSDVCPLCHSSGIHALISSRIWFEFDLARAGPTLEIKHHHVASPEHLLPAPSSQLAEFRAK